MSCKDTTIQLSYIVMKVMEIIGVLIYQPKWWLHLISIVI